ncbi:hypothetical protein M407DRAFT_170216 [Tulasnella calospora MUT 4182]|uniref:Uncharacterized protein n=1 Tax=Tulasnella calospora MUT 4182 TaxID=1051891 RepID=A0A0C3Q3H4_9AGAM|nr:hypothetical protein M407DRAFT_170216 [Tulasnella calospora MUT 4182]
MGSYRRVTSHTFQRPGQIAGATAVLWSLPKGSFCHVLHAVRRAPLVEKRGLTCAQNVQMKTVELTFTPAGPLPRSLTPLHAIFYQRNPAVLLLNRKALRPDPEGAF